MDYRLIMTDTSHDQITASAICDALGRRNIAARLDRKVTAVSNAATEGVFPSSWYLAIREMCAEAGIDCPEHLFSFVLPAEKDVA